MSEAWVPLVFFGGVALFFGWHVTRFGSFKGAIFGARLERSVGELDINNITLTKRTVRVHVLRDGKPDANVGVELVTKSFFSYQMHPLTLSRDDAMRLAALLQDAAQSSSTRPLGTP